MNDEYLNKLLEEALDNLPEDKGMSWEEAQELMKQGKWVRHCFFKAGHGITDRIGRVLLENQSIVTYDQLVELRFTNTYTMDEWTKSGWFLYPEQEEWDY